MTGYRGSLSRLKDQPGQHWTVILNPEKRKVGGSTPPLTTRIATYVDLDKRRLASMRVAPSI
jgi:hypothetical protein